MGKNSAKTSAALRYGNMLPKRAVSSMSSGVARSGQISPRTVNGIEMWGRQRWQSIQRGFLTSTVPNTVRIFRIV
jgi:hypothetical protein